MAGCSGGGQVVDWAAAGLPVGPSRMSIGSIFFQMQPVTSDIRTIYGALFLSLLFIAFGGMPEVLVVMSTRE